jgi:hypothetical protein
MAQTAIGQTVLAHVEAIALAAQQIIGWHFEIFDLHLAVTTAHDLRQRAFDGHGVDVAHDLIAGVRQLHDEG